MQDFADRTAGWVEAHSEVELELGVLVAAASEWTEDEMELDDLVSGLIDSGRVRLRLDESSPSAAPLPEMTQLDVDARN